MYGDTRFDSGSFDHGDEETREALWYYKEALSILEKIKAEDRGSEEEAKADNNNDGKTKTADNDKDHLKLTGLWRAAKMRMGRTNIRMGDFGKAMEHLPDILRYGTKREDEEKGEEEEGEEKKEGKKEGATHYGPEHPRIKT